MSALKLSADRKVSPLIRRQKSKDAPLVPNAFGLPAGVSCPGMTEFCGSCYAATTERVFTSSARLVASNLQTLLAHGDDVDALAEELGAMLDAWETSARKRDAARVFRIHWDGDFYSLPYARAWAREISRRPDAQFWAYTRSFHGSANVVPILADLPNLALYLSVDAWNVDQARDVLADHPNVLVAYCGETQEECARLAEKLERRSGPCPENVGRLPLVVAQSGRRNEPVDVGDDAQGACIACGLCVYGRRDVGFATAKR